MMRFPSGLWPSRNPAAIFWAMLEDEVTTVTIPQFVVIQGTRLGLVMRLLQMAVIVVMLLYAWIGQTWLVRTVPHASESAMSIWHTPRKANQTPMRRLAHCENSSAFWYDRQDYSDVRPQGCRSLSYEQAGTREQGAFFITTFVEEVSRWEGKGRACHAGTREECNNVLNGNFYSAVSATEICSCDFMHQYFTRDPEGESIHVSHGYQVDILHQWSRQTWVREGRFDSARVKEEYDGYDDMEWQSSILTIVQHPDGSRCTLNNKSEWTQTDGGIEGTLGEWLACADVSLNMHYSELKSSDTLTPRVRTMGITLMLKFDYRNKHAENHDGVVCYLTVRALPRWTSRPSTGVTINMPSINGSGSIYQHHVLHGVRFTTSVTGSFVTLDLSGIFRFLINFMVLFQVPRRVVHFTALYLLGLTSEVYRRAVRSKFHMLQHFRSAITRILVAEAGFRCSLEDGLAEKPEVMQRLKSKDVFERLHSIFQSQISDRILHMHDLRSIAMGFVAGSDNDGDHAISSSEFIQCYTDSDALDLSIMLRFFKLRQAHTSSEEMLVDSFRKPSDWSVETEDCLVSAVSSKGFARQTELKDQQSRQISSETVASGDDAGNDLQPCNRDEQWGVRCGAEGCCHSEAEQSKLREVEDFSPSLLKWLHVLDCKQASLLKRLERLEVKLMEQEVCSARTGPARDDCTTLVHATQTWQGEAAPQYGQAAEGILMQLRAATCVFLPTAASVSSMEREAAILHQNIERRRVRFAAELDKRGLPMTTAAVALELLDGRCVAGELSKQLLRIISKLEVQQQQQQHLLCLFDAPQLSPLLRKVSVEVEREEPEVFNIGLPTETRGITAPAATEVAATTLADRATNIANAMDDDDDVILRFAL